MKPESYDLYFYRNADFKFEFRIKCDGSYLDLTGYTIDFNASEGAGGTNVLSYSTGDSPSNIAVDASDNYKVTISSTSEIIDAITQATLFYTIDLVDSSDFDQRYMAGNIYIQNGAD